MVAGAHTSLLIRSDFTSSTTSTTTTTINYSSSFSSYNYYFTWKYTLLSSFIIANSHPHTHNQLRLMKIFYLLKHF